jgi:hypothetical protein
MFIDLGKQEKLLIDESMKNWNFVEKMISLDSLPINTTSERKSYIENTVPLSV